MTQQEALKELENLTIDYGKRTEEEIERMDEAVDMAIAALEQAEDCDTCKHGFFGSRQCDNCRVRYPSHYEREYEHHGSD